MGGAEGQPQGLPLVQPRGIPGHTEDCPRGPPPSRPRLLQVAPSLEAVVCVCTSSTDASGEVLETVDNLHHPLTAQSKAPGPGDATHLCLHVSREPAGLLRPLQHWK
eukprot:10281183-Lingulodinium_polyedra.AAC.1